MVTVIWTTNQQLYQQRELWQREKLGEFMRLERDRRLAALQSMHTAFAEAQRLAIVYASAGPEGQASITKLLHCSDAENRTAAPAPCDISPAPPSVMKVLEEFAALNGRFEAAHAATNALFCDETLAALRDLPQGPWWWNAGGSAKRRLTDAMTSDLNCGFGEILEQFAGKKSPVSGAGAAE